MPTHYVAIDYRPEGGNIHILGAYKTAARAKQSIAWQRAGQFEQPMYVCQWDDVGESYITDTGETLAAPKYTGSAV